MAATEIYVLANGASGTGVQSEVESYYKGNFGGLIYIDFAGTSFTAVIQARAESGDSWVTMATIDESTTPCQEIIIPARMRLNITAFNGTSLTVKVSG